MYLLWNISFTKKKPADDKYNWMSIKKQMSNIGNKDKNANKKSNKKHKQKSVNCSKKYRPKF